MRLYEKYWKNYINRRSARYVQGVRLKLAKNGFV